MTPTLSLVVNHAPWRPERVAALAAMMPELLAIDPERVFVHDTDYRGGGNWQAAKVRWALAQWTWSLRQPTTHHVFVTDDLHLAPGFVAALVAMVTAHPDVPIGLISNHPRGPELFDAGHHGYRTNAWIVGPAYVMPHQALVDFVRWFQSLPSGDATMPGTQAYRNDDSSINEWVTNGGGGGEVWHPLPTIVEHRGDLASTVGHGDRHSRERISWRERRTVKDDGERWAWVSTPWAGPSIAELASSYFWRGEAPMLSVGGEP